MAGPIKLGGEFQVNTNIANAQSDVQLAALTNGTYVAIWTSAAPGPEKHIVGQRFSASGQKLGSEFQVDTGSGTTEGTEASVAALSDGGFLVTWTLGAGDKILSQRYDAGGNADTLVVNQLQVNSINNGTQHNPAVAAANNGFWFVAFDSINVDNNGATDDRGIQGAIIDSDGNYDIPEFTIRAGGSTSADAALEPVVAQRADGGHVVAWRDVVSGNATINVQVYNASGIAVGLPIELGTRMDTKIAPAVTALANGDFLVSWSEVGDSTDTSLRMVRISETSPGFFSVGTEFAPIQGSGGQHPYDSAIIGTPDGGFVVVWPANVGSDPYDIYLQRFDANNVKIGGPVLVNSGASGSQNQPSVSVSKNGAVMVAWHDASGADGDGDGIFAQRFKAQLFGTNSGETINDTIGANWMSGRGGGDILKGRGGNDTILGDNGNDRLFGGNQNDILNGGNQNDILKGENGNDRLIAGKGHDTSTGGKGNDTFVYGKYQNVNTVTDFQNNHDRIDLKAFHFASKAQALSKFHEVGSNHNDVIKFQFKGTEIVVKGIDMPQLNGGDILI
ncbi:MAG: hypothetical protein H6873_12135 [Hyphomicrobiaceae bacterium]|nr:hypothetical protein [Hyphomicrobiaceae bacterium]